MTFKELKKKALGLPTTERARLVRALLGSLEGISDVEVESLWAEEAARRNAEAEADPSQEIPVEQSLREARELLR